MFRTLILFSALMATSACQMQESPENVAGNETTPANEVGLSNDSSAPIAEAPSSSTTNLPATTEPAPTPDEAKSPSAAVAVLERYCDAIDRKRYAQAYRLWAGNGEASGMSEREFAQSLAKYGAYDCSFGSPGPIEGAAGSAYITVPVVVTGTLTKGGGFALRGPMTLRRVNDVPGSTAEQRRWHISASEVKL